MPSQAEVPISSKSKELKKKNRASCDRGETGKSRK